MNTKHLVWLGAIAALTACDPFQNTTGGTPRVLSVMATGGVADDGASIVVEAAAPATDGAPWTIEASTTCTANASTADEFIVFVKANKLLDGFTVEQTPNTCVPFGVTAAQDGGTGWFTATGTEGMTQIVNPNYGQTSTQPGTPASEASMWYSCYYPSTSTATEGASVVFFRADAPRDYTNATSPVIPGDMSVDTQPSWFDLGAGLPVIPTDRTTYVIAGTVKDKAGNPMAINVELRLLPDGGAATLAASAVGSSTAPSVTLDWTVGDCTSAAAKYTVEEQAADGTWAPVAVGATDQTASGTVTVTYAPETYGAAHTYRLRETIVGAATGERFVKTKAEVSQVALETPLAPTFGTVTANSVVVNWAAVPGATSYKVERMVNVAGASYVTAAVVDAPTVTFTQLGLDPSTAYLFRIVATNANGDSLPGAEAGISTAAP